MAENREYYVQSMQNGTLQISEEVLSSIAAMAVLEVDGVSGLSAKLGSEIADILGMKSLNKGIRVTGIKEGVLTIDCNVAARFGSSVFELAKNVQEAVKSAVESVTSLTVERVNVNICDVTLPREVKK